MQNDKFTDLDLEFREMFHDAEEEVPSRVWESLSGELDRRAHRKVVALRWRRAAAGVAAAAAVMSGIFILSNRPDSALNTVSPVVAEAFAPQQTVQDTPSIEDQIAASSQLFVADIPAADKPSRPVTRPAEVVPSESFATDIAVEDGAQEEITVPEGTEAGNTSTVMVAAPEKKAEEPEVWTDPFAQLLEDEVVSRSHGVALSLSGNVMSNDATGNSGKISKAPVSNATQTTGITEKSISTYGVPLSLGVGAEISLSDKWSVGTGINWTLLSRSFTGIYTEVSNGNVVKAINSDINNEIHYIGIPVNFYYNVLTSRNLKFYAWGGGLAEKGLVNKFRIHSQPEDIFYKKSVEGIQWSAGLGLGLEFNLNDQLSLYIDPSARYYFDCDQPTSVRTQKPYMLNFEVGLRFNLN